MRPRLSLPSGLLLLCGVASLGCAELLGIEDWGGGAAENATTGGGQAGSGAGGTAGSGGKGGEPPPPTCGGTSLLADDFDGDAVSPQWSIVGEGNAEATTSLGNLRFELGGAAPGGISVRSTRFFDLVGDRVMVKVVDPPHNGSSLLQELVVYLDAQNLLRIRDQAGTLVSEAVVNGKAVSVGVEPLNPGQERYWRIREEGGTTYWETSPEGVTFVTRGFRATDTLFPLDVVRVQLRGASLSAVASQFVMFGEVNGGTPTGAYCKAAVLEDDFEDPARARAWALTTNSLACVQVEEGGKLVMTPQASTQSQCSYLSAFDYDLTDSSLSVVVEKSLDPAATLSSENLRAVADPANYLEIYEQGGVLHAGERAGSVDSFDLLTFDPAAHRYWRIREAAGTTFWEVSADAHNWTLLRAKTTPIAADRVQIYLGAGAYSETAVPGSVHFDDLNLVP